MEIKVNSNELTKKLEQATKVVPSKSSLPVLSNVMIETKGNVMILTTSDSEVWLSLKCEVKSCDDNAKFCVVARDLLELVKNINDKEISISLDKEALSMMCNYGNGNFSMPYCPADDFPTADIKTDERVDIMADSQKVLKAIELTSFATGNSPVYPLLNGIHFDFNEDGMTVSATDKFKIAIFKHKDTVSDVKQSFTLPQKSSSILSSVLGCVDGNIKLSICGNSISVNNANFKLTARLLEGNFPNCERIIPNSSPIVATVSKTLLLQALKRTMPMSDELSNLVVLSFRHGQVTLTADNKSFGKSANETIDCDCNSELKIGFKGSCLTDVLRNIEDENVIIELTDATRGLHSIHRVRIQETNISVYCHLQEYNKI